MKRFLRHNRRRLILTAVAALAVVIVALTLTFGVRWTTPSTPDSNGNSSINNPNNMGSVSTSSALFSEISSATSGSTITLSQDIDISSGNIGDKQIASGVTLDGQGHTIRLKSGFSISSATASNADSNTYSGLFATNYGTIKNLNVVIEAGYMATGVHGVGGLVGLNVGTIENCSVTINSDVTVIGQYYDDLAVGGLVGVNGISGKGGVIKSCTVVNKGTLQVNANGEDDCFAVAGVVGAMQKGSLYDVTISGAGKLYRHRAQDIYYWGCLGGIIGYMRSTGTGTVNFSVDTSDISLSYLQYNFSGTYDYDQSYSTSNTDNGECFLGAIVGDASSVTVSVDKVFYSGSSLNTGVSNNLGTGSATEVTATKYVGRASSLTIGSAHSYSGTIEISTGDGLVSALSGDVYGRVSLTSDITLTSTQVASLGSAVLYNIFDGNDHTVTVSGGTISGSNSAYSGIICATNNGIISNLTIKVTGDVSTNISTLAGFGVIAGLNLGTINNVTVSIASGVTVSTSSNTDNATAGVAGRNGNSSTAGTISGCSVYLNGTLSTSTSSASHVSTAGITGAIQNGTVKDVAIYGSGTIKSTGSSGWRWYSAIIGGTRSGSASGSNYGFTYSSATISGIYYAFSGTFSYCSASENFVGALVGDANANSVTIKGVQVDGKYVGGQLQSGTTGNSSGSGTIQSDSNLKVVGRCTGTVSVTQTWIEPPSSYLTPSAMDYGKVYETRDEGTGSISSAAELAAFLNGTGTYGYLTQDIEYTSALSGPIGSLLNETKTLDGNGYSIIFNNTSTSSPGTGLTVGVNNGANVGGLLASVNNGIIKNLKLVLKGINNYYLVSSSSPGAFGALVGENNGVIENVSVIAEDSSAFRYQPNSPGNASYSYFGLLVGRNYGYIGYAGAYIGTGAAVEHHGSTGSHNAYTGGIVGCNEEKGVVEYSSIYGAGTLWSYSSAGTIALGGIVGYNAGAVDYCYGGFYGTYRIHYNTYIGSVVGYSAKDLTYNGLGSYIGSRGSQTGKLFSDWDNGYAAATSSSSETSFTEQPYNAESSSKGVGLLGGMAERNTSVSYISGAYFVYNGSHSSVKVRGFYDYASPDGILLLELDNPALVSSYTLSSSDATSHPVQAASAASIGDKVCAAYNATTREAYVYTRARTDTDLLTLTVNAPVSTTLDALDLANSGYATSSAFHGYHTDATAITQADCTTTSCIFPLSGTSNYYLAEDIIVDLTTIGQQPNAFSGILYGNGHTITLVNDRDGSTSAVFTYTSSHGRAMGIITSWLYGAIYDLNVVLEGTMNLKSENDKYGSGIFAGIITSATVDSVTKVGVIDNCSLVIKEGAAFKNDNTANKQGGHAGFVGRVEAGNTITNIYFENNGEISASVSSGWITLGGIVALVAAGNSSSGGWNIQKIFITGSGTISITNGSYTTTTLLGSFTTSCDWSGDTISYHSAGNLMEYVYLQDYSMTISDKESRAGIYGVNQNGTSNASIAARVHKGTGVSGTLQYVAMNNKDKHDMTQYDVSSIGTIKRYESGAYIYTKANTSVDDSLRYVYDRVDMSLTSATHSLIRRYTTSTENYDRHAIYGYYTTDKSIRYEAATKDAYHQHYTVGDTVNSTATGIKVLNRYYYAVHNRSSLGLDAQEVAYAVYGHDGEGSAVLGSGTASVISGASTDYAGYYVYSSDSTFGLVTVLPGSHNMASVHATYGSTIGNTTTHQGYYLTSTGTKVDLNGIKFYSDANTQASAANAPYQTTPSATLLDGKSVYTVKLTSAPYTLYDGKNYVTYYVVNSTVYIAQDTASARLMRYTYVGEATDKELMSSDGKTSINGYIHQALLDTSKIVYSIGNANTANTTNNSIYYSGSNTWIDVSYNGSLQYSDVFFNSTNTSGIVTKATYLQSDTDKSNSLSGDYIRNANAYRTYINLTSTGNYAFGVGSYETYYDWTIAKAPVKLTLKKTDNAVSKIYDGSGNVVTLTDVVTKLHGENKTVYTGAFSTDVSGLTMGGRLSYTADTEPTTFIGQDDFVGVGFYDIEIALSQDLMSDGSDSTSNFKIESIEYSSVARYEIKSVLIKTAVSDLQGEQSREYTAAKQYFATSSLVDVDVDGALSAQFSDYGKSGSYADVKAKLEAEASQYMDVAYVYVGGVVDNEYTFINAERADATTSEGAGIGAITTGGAINAGKYNYIGYSLSGNFKINTSLFSSLTNELGSTGIAYATVYNGAASAFKTTGSTWDTLGAMFGYDFYSYNSSDPERLNMLATLIGAADNDNNGYNSAVSSGDTNIPYITKASVSIVADDQSVEYGANLLAAGTLRSDAYTISALPDAMSKDVFKQSLIDNGFSWSVNTEEYSSILKSYTDGDVTVKYLDVRYDGDGTITAWRNAIAPSEYTDYNLNITYIYGNLTVYQKELKIEWIYNGSAEAQSLLGSEYSGSAYQDSAYSEDLHAYVYDGAEHSMTLHRKLNLMPGDESVSTIVSHTGGNAIKGTDVGTYSGFYVYFDPSQSGSAWKNYYLGDGASGAFKIVKKTLDVTIEHISIDGVTDYGFLSRNTNNRTIIITLGLSEAPASGIQESLKTVLKNNVKLYLENYNSNNVITMVDTSLTGATVSFSGTTATMTISTLLSTSGANNGREFAYVIDAYALNDCTTLNNYCFHVTSDFSGSMEIQSYYQQTASNALSNSYNTYRPIGWNNSTTEGHENWNNNGYQSSFNFSDTNNIGSGVITLSGTSSYDFQLADYQGMGEAYYKDNWDMSARRYVNDNQILWQTKDDYYGDGRSIRSIVTWFDITAGDAETAEKLKNGQLYVNLYGIFATAGRYASSIWYFSPAAMSMMIYGIEDAYDRSIEYGPNLVNSWQSFANTDYLTGFKNYHGLSDSDYKVWVHQNTHYGKGGWGDRTWETTLNGTRKASNTDDNIKGDLINSNGITGYSSFRIVFLYSHGDNYGAKPNVMGKIQDLKVSLVSATGNSTEASVNADLGLDVNNSNKLYTSHRLSDGNFEFTMNANNNKFLDPSKISVVLGKSGGSDKTLTVGNGLKVISDFSGSYKNNRGTYNLPGYYKYKVRTTLDELNMSDYYVKSIRYGDWGIYTNTNVVHNDSLYGVDETPPDIYITSVDGINYAATADGQAQAMEALYGGWVNTGSKVVQIKATESNYSAWTGSGVERYASGLRSLEWSSVSPQFDTSSSTKIDSTSYADITLTLTIEAGKAYYLRATDGAGNTVVKTLYFETNDTYSANNLEIAVRPEESGTDPRKEAEENVWTNKDIIMLLSGRGEGNSLARLYYRRIYTSRIPSEEPVVFEASGCTEIASWTDLKDWLTMTADTSSAYKYGRLTAAITIDGLGIDSQGKKETESSVLSLNEGRVLDGNGNTLTINADSAVRSKTLDVVLNAMTFTKVASRFLYENNGSIINLTVSVSGIENEFSQNTLYSSFIAINNGTLSGVTMTVSETDVTARNSYEYTVVVGGLTAVNRGYIDSCELTVNTLTVSAKSNSNSNANVVSGGLTAVNDSGTIKGNKVDSAPLTMIASANAGYESYAALVAVLVNHSVTNYDLISSLNIVVRGNAYTHNPVIENEVTGYATATTASDEGSAAGVGVAACYTGSDVNYGWIALQASAQGDYIVISDTAWVINHSGIYSLEIMIESGTGDRAYAVYSSSGNLYYNSYDKTNLSSVQSKEVDSEQQHTHDSTTVYELSDGKFVNPEAGSSTSYDYYEASYNEKSGVYDFSYHGVGGTTKSYTVNPTTQEVKDSSSTIVGTVISSGTSVSIFYIGTDKYLVDFTTSNLGSALTLVKDGGEYSEARSEGYFNIKIDKRSYNVSFETVIDIVEGESKADTVLNDPEDIDEYISYTLKKNDSSATAISAYANVYWNADESGSKNGPAHSSTSGVAWKLGADGILYEVDKDGKKIYTIDDSGSIVALTKTVSALSYTDKTLTCEGYTGSFGYFYYTLDASSENDSSSWTSIEMNTVKKTSSDKKDTWYGIAEIETFKVSYDEDGKEAIDRTVVLSSFNGTEWDIKEVGTGNTALIWSRLASVNVPRGDDVDDMDDTYNMIVRVHIKYYASLDVVTTDDKGVETQLSSVYGDLPATTTYTTTISSTAVKGTAAAQELLNNKTASFYALDLTGSDIYYNPTSYAIYDVKTSGSDYIYYTRQLLAAQGVRGSELYSIDLYNADPSLMVNRLTPVGDHHLVLKEVNLGSDSTVGNYILNFNVLSYYKVEKRPVYVNIEDNFGKLYDGTATWSSDLNRTGKKDSKHPNELAETEAAYTVKAPKYSYLADTPDATTSRAYYNIGDYNTGISETYKVTKKNTIVTRSYNFETMTSTETLIGSHYGDLNKGTLTLTVYGTKVTVSKEVSESVKIDDKTVDRYAIYIDGVRRGYYILNSTSTLDYGEVTIFTAPVDIDYAYFMVHTGSTEAATPNVGGTLKLFLSDKSYYTFGTITVADDDLYTVTDDVPVYTGDERQVEALTAIGTYTSDDSAYVLEFELDYTEFKNIKVVKSTGVIYDDSNRVIGSVDDYGLLNFSASDYTPSALRGEVLTLEDGVVYDETVGWSAVELGSDYATMYKRAIYVRATGMSVETSSTSVTFDGSVKASSANAGFSEETDETTIKNALGKDNDILSVWGTLTGETAELSTKSDGTATGTQSRPILAGSYKISYKLSDLTESSISLDGISANSAQALNPSSREDNYYVAKLIKSSSTTDTSYVANLTISKASNMLYVNRVMSDDGSYRVRVTVSNLNRSINGLQFLNAADDFTVDGVNYFGLFIDEIRNTGTFDMSLETSAKQTLYNSMQQYFSTADGDTTSTAYQAGLEIQKQLSSDVKYLVQKALGRIFRYAVNSTQSFATVSVAYNKDSFSNLHFDATSGKLTFDYLGDSAKDSAYLADRYSVKVAGNLEAATDTPGSDTNNTGYVDSSNISMTTSALSDGQVTATEYAVQTGTAISTAEELQAWLSMTDSTAIGYSSAYLTDNILGFDWGIKSVDGVVTGGAPVGLATGRTLDGRGYSIELAGNQVSQSGGNIAMHYKEIALNNSIQVGSYNSSGIFLKYIEAGAQIKNINFVYTANRYYKENASNKEMITSSIGRAIGIIAGVVQTSATRDKTDASKDKPQNASLYNIALEIRGKFGYSGADEAGSSIYSIGGIAGIIDGNSYSYGMVNSTIYYYSSPSVGNIDWTWETGGSYDIYIERSSSGTGAHIAYGALVGSLSQVTLKNISTRTELMSSTDTQPKIYVGNSGPEGWLFVGGGIGFSRRNTAGEIDGYINKFKGNINVNNTKGEAFVGAISGCTYNDSGSVAYSNVYSYYSNYGSSGLNLFSITQTASSGDLNKTDLTTACLTGYGNLLSNHNTKSSDATALTLKASTNLNVGYSDSDTSTPGLIDYYFGSNNYGSTYVTDKGKEYVDYYYNTVFINDSTVAFNPFWYDGWTAGTVIYDSYLRKTDNVVGSTSSLTPAKDETFTLNDVTYKISNVTESDGTYTVTATAAFTSTDSTATESTATYLFTFDKTTYSFINEQTQTKYYYGQPHVDNGTSDIKTADASSINIEVLAPNGYFVWDYHLANYTNTLTEQGAVTRLVWSTAIGNTFESNYATPSSATTDATDETKYFYNASGRDTTGNKYWTKSWHNAVLGTYSISASDAPSSEFVYKYTGEVETAPISVTVHVTYVNKKTYQLIDEYYTAKVTMTEEMVNVGSYVVSEFEGIDFDDSVSGGTTSIATMTRVLTGSSSGNQIMIIIVPQEITLKDDVVLTKTYDGTTKLVIPYESLEGFLGKSDVERNIAVELDYNSKNASDNDSASDGKAEKVTADNHNSKTVLVDSKGNYMSFVKDTSYSEYFTVTGISRTVAAETTSYVQIRGGSHAYYYVTGDTATEKKIYDEFGKEVGTMTTTGDGTSAVSNVSINCRYYLTTINYSDGLYTATAGKFNMADNIPRVSGWVEQTAEEMNKLKAFYYAYMQVIPALRFKDTPFYATYIASDKTFKTDDDTTYNTVEVYNLYANVTEDKAAAVRFYVLPTLDDGDNGVTARNYALLPDDCYVNPFIIKDLTYTVDVDGTTLKVGSIAVGTESSDKLTLDGKEYTLADGYATSTTDINVGYTYTTTIFGSSTSYEYEMTIGGKQYTADSNNRIIKDSSNNEIGSFEKKVSGDQPFFVQGDTIVLHGITYIVQTATGTSAGYTLTASATIKFGYSNNTVNTSAATGAGAGSDANFSRAATITRRELDVEYSNLIWDKDSADTFTAPKGTLSFDINAEAVSTELNKNRLTDGEKTALDEEYKAITVSILDSNTLAEVNVSGKDYYKAGLIAGITNQNFAIKVNRDKDNNEIAAYLGQNTLTTQPIFLYSTLSGEKKDGDKEYYLVVKDIADLELLVTKTELSDASVRLSQDIDASDLTGSIKWGSRSGAIFDGQNHVIGNYFCDTIFTSGVVGTVKDVKFMNVESWADDSGEILGLGTNVIADNVVIHGTDFSGRTPKATKGIKYEMTYYNGDTLRYVSNYVSTLTTSEADLAILNTYILCGRFTATADNNGLTADTPLLISSSKQLLDAVASFPNLYFRLTTNINLKSGESLKILFSDRKTIDFNGFEIFKSDGSEITSAEINPTSQSAA